jgi:hypothetical protein
MRKSEGGIDAVSRCLSRLTRASFRGRRDCDAMLSRPFDAAYSATWGDSSPILPSQYDIDSESLMDFEGTNHVVSLRIEYHDD